MMKKYVIDLYAGPSKVGLLLIPVDTAMFRPAAPSAELRQKWGLAADDRIILFIGTLFEFSGLDVLIRRFPEVLKEAPQAKLLIVGDGPQRSKLEKAIAETGLQGRVVITGFQPYNTMPQYINMSALCINTFLTTDITRDIFPSKIVQYLACGKAVVATRLPGMAAVISGEEGGVAYCDSVEEMPAALIALLKNGERRQRLEQAGLAYAREKHSNEIIAHQLEEKLQEIIREKRTGKTS
jgi:glycosyltransferase involved in cell wall biosynthesis